MNEILIEDEQEKTELTGEIIDTVIKVCNYSLQYEECDFDAEISITFTDNEGIREINCEHRGIDKPTDVLSFPLLEFDADGNVYADEAEYNGDKIMLGDIIISLERAVQQAEEYGHSLRREVAFLTAHSMLHLLGYDHVDDIEGEKVMFEKQSEILNNLGITRQ